MNYIRYTEARGLFASTLTEGEDATIITNLGDFAVQNIGQSWITDWKTIRTSIKNLAITITGNPDIPTWTTEQWNLFSDTEKYILCQFLPNKIDIAYMLATLGSLEAVFAAADYFDTNSRISRASRWNAARRFVMMSFGIEDIMYTIQHDVINFSNSDWNGVDLSSAYIKGYEQQSEDFRYGLIDYVNNELASSGLVPINGMTLPQVVAVPPPVRQDVDARS
jgi:hypothetical protein